MHRSQAVPLNEELHTHVPFPWSPAIQRPRPLQGNWIPPGQTVTIWNTRHLGWIGKTVRRQNYNIRNTSALILSCCVKWRSNRRNATPLEWNHPLENSCTLYFNCQDLLAAELAFQCILLVSTNRAECLCNSLQAHETDKCSSPGGHVHVERSVRIFPGNISKPRRTSMPLCTGKDVQTNTSSSNFKSNCTDCNQYI